MKAERVNRMMEAAHRGSCDIWKRRSERPFRTFEEEKEGRGGYTDTYLRAAVESGRTCREIGRALEKIEDELALGRLLLDRRKERHGDFRTLPGGRKDMTGYAE